MDTKALVAKSYGVELAIKALKNDAQFWSSLTSQQKVFFEFAATKAFLKLAMNSENKT